MSPGESPKQRHHWDSLVVLHDYSGGRGGSRWAETFDPGFVVGGLAAHLLVNAYLRRRGQDAVAVSQGNGCRKQLNVVVVGAAREAEVETVGDASGALSNASIGVLGLTMRSFLRL
jgi:hypothetical protein